MGALTLRNRMVMAPLTRGRAGPGDVPTATMATYYAQRASAGLIITEASQISPQGKGYLRTPGIYSAQQIEGWQGVTEAVHAQGGHIFLQLWHVGRLSHRVVQPQGEQPVAPSAIQPQGEILTAQGMKQLEAPRALERDEIAGIVADYAQAARNAKAAGFDGVEIHAANGYLIDQFLRDGANQRTDDYGGSVENRARFLREVVEAVIPVFGAAQTGVRLSPRLEIFSMSDSDPRSTFGYAADMLRGYGLAYLHGMEGGSLAFDFAELKRRFGGVYMANSGYDAQRAAAAIAEQRADLVAFGVPFLANPDLVERFRVGAPLNAPDPATFYQGEERGYIDYPTLAQPSDGQAWGLL